MPCYKPLRAWRRDDGEIVFAERGRIHSELTLACGQCRGCRLEKSRQWAVRCMHESKMHQQNCFLTLTYDDEHLNQKYWTGKYREDGSKAYAGNLHYRDFQLFFKRLRRPLPPNSLLFYMAGEYGEQYRRPHWHACIFGYDFPDKKYLGLSPAGSKLYESDKLQTLWPHGFSSIGELTFESAAYTARYVMKKINGPQAKEHYTVLDHDTGELLELEPEFNNMSRSQGIGQSWLKKYQADVYPHAKVIVRGKKTNPPRYYDKQYKASHPVEWEGIEYDRFLNGKKHWEEQLPHRLIAREQVAAAQIKQLRRKL